MRDMPSIEAFPKSHRVAYNYFVGRIYFMEEDYLKVFFCHSFCLINNSIKDLRKERRKSIYQVPGVCVTGQQLRIWSMPFHYEPNR